PMLFDISYLAAHGFDDQASGTIPVIVQFANHDQAAKAVHQGMVDTGIHLTHLFEYEPLASGYVSKDGPFVPTTPDHAVGIEEIWLDGVATASPELISPLLDSSLPLIDAHLAHQRGLTGKGVRVAIVDTGIDGNHPDLKGRVVAAANFSSDRDTLDHMGHGTHVAGIVGGTGAASDGKYGGVAPQAELLNAKALNRSGGGTNSGILKAMEWAADQGARIESLSLGGGATNGTDPLSQAVNNISAKKNVLFVIAAGNSGQRSGNGRLVSTPGAADAALTVGAIDKSKNLAPFSSRGPRLGDFALKPDIVAPGVNITSARANGSDGNWYVAYSGTSMATPMVSGAAAIVWQLHPGWSAQQVKAALMNAANPIGPRCEVGCDTFALAPGPTSECSDTTGCLFWEQPVSHLDTQAAAEPCDGCDGYVGAFDQGSGLVALAGNLNQSAVSEPASLSYGALKGSEQQTRALTLRNLTGATLTMVPIAHLQGPEGSLQGGIGVSAGVITLPPGGTTALRVGIQGPPAPGPYTGDISFIDETTGTRVARATLAFVIR
ncbi:MAG TPA: S8 family serine peptidase, partial [Chloroflexota bacterium]